jgi:hypothetical protein
MANPYRDKRGRFSSAGGAAMTIGGIGAMAGGIALASTGNFAAGASLYAAGLGSAVYANQVRARTNAQAQRIADKAFGYKAGNFEGAFQKLASGSMPNLDKQAAATLRAANRAYKKK